MDACLGYLHEIDILMEDYQELPLYMDIFEAASDDVAKITAKNAEIEKKTTNLFHNAIQVVRDIFAKIKEMLSNIKDWFGASKEEKANYNAFVKECKENKEFANMKITLHDYREINSEYSKVLKKYEDEYKKIKGEEEELRPTIPNMIKTDLEALSKKAKAVGGAAGKAVAVETALNYAKACRENAYEVEKMLEFDTQLLDELDKTIGEKERKKLTLQVKALRSRIPFVRLIAGGRKEQIKTIEESLQEVLGSVKGCSKQSVALGRRMLKYGGKDSLDAAKTIYGINKLHDDTIKGIDKATRQKKKYAYQAYDRQMMKEKNTIDIARKNAMAENKKRDADARTERLMKDAEVRATNEKLRKASGMSKREYDLSQKDVLNPDELSVLNSERQKREEREARKLEHEQKRAERNERSKERKAAFDSKVAEQKKKHEARKYERDVNRQVRRMMKYQ